ncbi:MAG: TRAP transporter substrate-binding protein DctP [Opitutaceae bacterium]
MMTSLFRLFLLFSVTLFVTGVDEHAGKAEAAGRIRIKLTTLAPKGSSFHKALMEMGQSWKEASDGRIDLIVYAGGIQGGESAMVERMTINQTQAALLTGVGLADIERDVTGLQTMPMVFRSVDEFDYVSKRIYPRLEKSLREKGYVTLFWADAGFLRFFSRKPVVTLDDLRSLKLFTVAGDAKQEALMVSTGLNPVPLDLTDILISLQTGLIDAVPLPPLYALAIQTYGPAPHMTNLLWAPIMGAAVIKEETWNSIPAEIRPKLLEAARRAGDFVLESGRRENEEAIDALVDQWGVQVHDVPPAAMAEWEQAVSAAYPEIRGGLVPPAIFDEVMKLIDEYRASN